MRPPPAGKGPFLRGEDGNAVRRGGTRSQLGRKFRKNPRIFFAFWLDIMRNPNNLESTVE
jgi:hypothetical protein